MNPFKLIGGIVGKLLPILGVVGKGRATITGVVAAVAGVGIKHFIGDVLTAENLVETIRAVADIITALGTVIAAFGFGRKAGYAATGGSSQ